MFDPILPRISDLTAVAMGSLSGHHAQEPNLEARIPYHARAWKTAVANFPALTAMLVKEGEFAQLRVSQNSDGGLVAATNNRRLQPGLQRRSHAAGGVRKLAQEPPDLGIALAGPSERALSGGFIVPKTDAHPGSKAVGVAEAAHIAADLDEHHDGADGVDTGQGLQRGQRTMLARQLLAQTEVEPGDARFQFLDLPRQFARAEHVPSIRDGLGPGIAQTFAMRNEKLVFLGIPPFSMSSLLFPRLWTQCGDPFRVSREADRNPFGGDLLPDARRELAKALGRVHDGENRLDRPLVQRLERPSPFVSRRWDRVCRRGVLGQKRRLAVAHPPVRAMFFAHS